MSKERIIGFDLSSQKTGYAVLLSERTKVILEEVSFITFPKLELKDKMGKLFSEANKLIKRFKPRAIIVESIYYHKNPKTSAVLNQLKGVIMLVSSLSKISFYEFPATEIRKAVVGYGSASKQQVNYMVSALFGIKKNLSEDEADAIAVALTYVNRFIRGNVSYSVKKIH